MIPIRTSLSNNLITTWLQSPTLEDRDGVVHGAVQPHEPPTMAAQRHHRQRLLWAGRCAHGSGTAGMHGIAEWRQHKG